MTISDENTQEDRRPDTGPIASRMRFEDPAKFLQFFEKQLSKSLVGLRHPTPIEVGTTLIVVISPPGAPDQLQLNGSVSQVTPRSDGTVRLRVEVTLAEADTIWLEAYLAGLRAALEAASARSPTPPAASSEAPPQPEPPLVGRDEILDLAMRLDSLTYYQLLDVPSDITGEALQRHFHGLTRHYHPDMYVADPDRRLRGAVNAVYRRMNEAYAVLKSPPRRKAYDQGLAGPAHTWTLRLSESALEEARRRERVRRGSTRVGDFYWKTAREVLEAARAREDNIRPALRESAKLLRVALAFEPDNEHFSHALDHLTDRLSQPE